MKNWNLPAQYKSRQNYAAYDDTINHEADVIHQPEVYTLAEYLLKITGRQKVIDIGCGSANKLMQIDAQTHIGIDSEATINWCRWHYINKAQWLATDLDSSECTRFAALGGPDSVVICSDVIEHVLDPTHLLNLLKAFYLRGAIVITSTPDRIKVRGEDHMGPPPNQFHIREWALREYEDVLNWAEFPPSFIGYSLNNTKLRENKTIVSVHDHSLNMSMKAFEAISHEGARPLAIMAAFNEEDMIGESINDLLLQGCDVHCIDNWSTDSTPEILQRLRDEHPQRVTIERFPAEGPSEKSEWHAILRHKEVVAANNPGRWIIHTDADEIRRAPFAGYTLANALAVARIWGANRIDFSVINFRPTDEAAEERPGLAIQDRLHYFEFGSKPGHFLQYKAWFQGDTRVALADSGGHDVKPGEEAVDFPYKFLLKHYPIRSINHGMKKVFHERNDRWSEEELKKGWHSQYRDFNSQEDMTWNRKRLCRWDNQFWIENIILTTSDLLRRRFNEGHLGNPEPTQS